MRKGYDWSEREDGLDDEDLPTGWNLARDQLFDLLPTWVNFTINQARVKGSRFWKLPHLYVATTSPNPHRLYLVVATFSPTSSVSVFAPILMSK